MSPVFGPLPVQAVDTGLVMKIIGPLWAAKPETASRVRGRIEVILDWAKVGDYRQGENPARWRGHLDHLLPAGNPKSERSCTMPRCGMAQIGAFMVALSANTEGSRRVRLSF